MTSKKSGKISSTINADKEKNHEVHNRMRSILSDRDIEWLEKKFSEALVSWSMEK